jgi:hypothetical protein
MPPPSLKLQRATEAPARQAKITKFLKGIAAIFRLLPSVKILCDASAIPEGRPPERRSDWRGDCCGVRRCSAAFKRSYDSRMGTKSSLTLNASVLNL